MSTDYAAKEREFLDSLKADTGRDLSEWMAAIRAQALPHRNDIIDWLRQQGFMFSRASWLERIHNAGRSTPTSRRRVVRRPASRHGRFHARTPFPSGLRCRVRILVRLLPHRPTQPRLRLRHPRPPQSR